MDRTLFDPIIGHSRLKKQFARLIDEDRIPHAMILPARLASARR